MAVNLANLSASLDIMWKGMLGLFLVCGFISLLIKLVQKIITAKGKN